MACGGLHLLRPLGKAARLYGDEVAMTRGRDPTTGDFQGGWSADPRNASPAGRTTGRGGEQH